MSTSEAEACVAGEAGGDALRLALPAQTHPVPPQHRLGRGHRKEFEQVLIALEESLVEAGLSECAGLPDVQVQDLWEGRSKRTRWGILLMGV